MLQPKRGTWQRAKSAKCGADADVIVHEPINILPKAATAQDVVMFLAAKWPERVPNQVKFSIPECATHCATLKKIQSKISNVDS